MNYNMPKIHVVIYDNKCQYTTSRASSCWDVPSRRPVPRFSDFFAPSFQPLAGIRA